MLRWIKENKIVGILLALIVVTGVTLAPTHVAHAGPINALWGAVVGGAKFTVNGFFDVFLGIAYIFVAMGYVLLNGVLWLAEQFFDLAIKISIVDFPRYANMPAITIIWKIGRDLANMSFIFLLLSSAIGTMLDADKLNLKKNLPKILIIALLINFSLPIARTVVDASNLLALEFYNKIYSGSGTGDSQSMIVILNKAFIPFSSVAAFKNQATIADTLNTVDAVIKTEFAKYVGACFFLLNAIVVLFFGAFLLFFRVVSLLFILALSSLAFFASIVPSAEKYYSQWWDQLINQSIFAPAYMFMLYFVFQFITSSNLFSNIETFTKTAGDPSIQSGSAIVTFFNFAPVLDTAIYFIFLIGLMTGAMYVATQLGAAGASQAKKAAEKTTDFLTSQIKQNTFGAGVRYFTGNSGGKNSENGTLARAAGSVAKYVPFGAGTFVNDRFKGWKDAAKESPNGAAGTLYRALGTQAAKVGKEGFGRKEELEDIKNFVGKMDPDDQLVAIKALDETTRDNTYEGLNERQKATLEDPYKDKISAAEFKMREAADKNDQVEVKKQEDEIKKLKVLQSDHEKDKDNPQSVYVKMRDKYTENLEQRDKFEEAVKKAEDNRKLAETRRESRRITKKFKENALAEGVGGPDFNDADKTALKKFGSGDIKSLLNEIASGSLQEEDKKENTLLVVNNLNFAQFKSFVTKEENFSNKQVQQFIREAHPSKIVQKEFNTLIENNPAARENLGLPAIKKKEEGGKGSKGGGPAGWDNGTPDL